MKKQEYGSDFHYLIGEDYLYDKQECLFYGSDFSLFFSGRVALYNLLEQGISQYGWKSVYLPSFYCHEVTDFLKQLPIKTLYYEFNPFLDSEIKKIEVEDFNTNVIVNVNFFGIRKLDLTNYKSAIQIDDVTHSIVDFKTSQAHYCFGSLRKELPVPVGGFCFSPKKLPLPIGVPNAESEQIAIQKLSAMFLKSQYLEGKYQDKDSFRRLFIDAENNFEHSTTNTAMPQVAMSVLYSINSDTLLSKKRRNVLFALENLVRSNKIGINIQSKNITAFGLIFQCTDLESRNNFREYLIKNMIFPAVLWPNQHHQRDQDIEDKILFVHMDYRYNLKDIEDIINIINDFIKNE